MRTWVAFFLLAAMVSCGIREIKDEKASVLGVWDSTVCQDRLALNEDLTFIWDDRDMNLGSYWVVDDQLNFKYPNKLSETYQFTVTERTLTLLKNNKQYEYVKVPPIFTNGHYIIPPVTQKPTKGNSDCL